MLFRSCESFHSVLIHSFKYTTFVRMNHRRTFISVMLIAAIMLRFSSSFACFDQSYSPNGEHRFQHKSEHVMSAWLESSEEFEEEDSEGFEKEFFGGQPEYTHRFHQALEIRGASKFNAPDHNATQGNSIYLLCRSWRL